MAGFCYLETSRALQGNGLNPSPTIAPHAARSGAASRPHMRVGAAHLGRHITVMYNLLTTSFSDLWQTMRSAKIDMRMTRRIAQRLAAIIRSASDRFEMRFPSSVVDVWIRTVAGAFLISICFLISFIAADLWMSRRPTSLQSICSNVLELYKSRDEITNNEKWQQELSRLHDDCAVALHKTD
jgi:hypothetical protein